MKTNKAKKILVVEDDAFAAKAILTKVKTSNIEADLAVDGEEALKKLREGNYQLILLDLLLPNKDGFWLLDQLKKEPKLKELKVLIFSNLSKPEERGPLLKNLMIVDYIVKSEINIEEMIKRIAQFLD